jgi:hypothetical protein
LQVDRPLDTDEGHWLAGFIEGEAHLAISDANGGQSFRCLMSLCVRDDDVELMEWIHARTQVGSLNPVPARRTSRPQVQWLVRTQDDCMTLVDLLSEFPMRGRKRVEFEIWRSAVELWTSGMTNREVLARVLRDRLLDARRFRAPDGQALPPLDDGLRGYLHGLVCAEGSFSLAPSKTGLALHMRRDERPLLAMLQRALGLGRLCDSRAYPPASPSTTWHVSRLEEAERLAGILDPALLRGRKARELEIWLRAVEERRSAQAAGRVADLDDLIAEFRAARLYRPGRPPVTNDRAPDPREEALAVLRDWAAREHGSLSCSRYARARQHGWPTRNTISRRFGSWDAALRAAGLEDRLARAEPRPVGGGAAREARAERQRERVLQTLRYLINVHGEIPSAMQFFRWRLAEAPATPTQATVYRLFPGGWQAVLDALGHVDPGVLCHPAPAR